jgi:hypothetical protein
MQMDASRSGESVDVHAFRHSTATLMAKAGVPLLELQKFLGHSDPKVTAQYYVHLLAEDLRASVELRPARRAITGNKVATAGGDEGDPAPPDSSQVVPRRAVGDGVSEGNRTPDLRNHNPAL